MDMSFTLIDIWNYIIYVLVSAQEFLINVWYNIINFNLLNILIYVFLGIIVLIAYFFISKLLSNKKISNILAYIFFGIVILFILGLTIIIVWGIISIFL